MTYAWLVLLKWHVMNVFLLLTCVSQLPLLHVQSMDVLRILIVDYVVNLRGYLVL